MRLRGGKNEHHVWRRLLQRFEQCIERLFGEHVYLVYVHNAVAAARGGKLHVVSQISYVINTAVRGTVNLLHIQIAPLGYLPAYLLIRVKVYLGAAGAVEGFGKNTRGGGFARATGAYKKVRVRQALLLYRIAQRTHHVILPQHILKCARPVFSGKNLITHAPYSTLFSACPQG